MSVSGLLPLLSEHESYREICARLGRWQRSNASWRLPGLLPAAHPTLLAALQRDLGAPLLVVVPRAEEAKSLHEQLQHWSASTGALLLYPEPDVLPFERAPGGDLAARQRMAVLARLSGFDAQTDGGGAPIVVASVRALVHRTIALRDLAANSRVLRRGQRAAMSTLLAHWLRLGYEPVTLVEEAGQFSRRGGIVDVFPVTGRDPVRLEFVGDDIDSLRRFDPATQRSTEPTDAVTITPPSEVLPEDAVRVSADLLALDTSQLGPETQEQWRVDVERLRAGATGQAGRELWQFYAPFFHASKPQTTLLDHFDGLIVIDSLGETAAAALGLQEEAEELRTSKAARGEILVDFPTPFIAWAEMTASLARRPRLVLEAQPADPLSAQDEEMLPTLPISPAPLYGGRLKQAIDDCLTLRQERQSVVISSHQAMRLSALLRERDAIALPVDHVQLPPPQGSLTLVQGSLAEGWQLGGRGSASGLTLLTDVELFGWAKPRRTGGRRRAAAQHLLSELAAGDYVVHIEHGVGVFRGLVKLNLGGAEREYLQIDYAQKDQLFVPSDQVDRVSRYVGVGDAVPTLTTLGAADWEHAKRRARKAVQDVARELLARYAARQVAQGTAFSGDGVWQAELEASFPYVETADQLRAIDDVKMDMEREQPMDRLICGDVGYGKTEVALRAAFKAVADSKQVALLVPTTILAQQHYNTFRERLAAFPVRVEMLSRFRSSRQQRRIIKSLADGQIDICIGTHRLIQRDVAFKNLGLVIIDEEQRFGVMHKEQLKRLRQEVDVLTLTATPIPRTLHMSLVGARDMSTIDTPPEDRLPITTVVSPYDENVIKQAILRELDRGGQVYFVHNRVHSIEHVTNRLQALLPNVTFAVGHGQMPEEHLERVMLEFASGKTDVLVCTAIIESGVDIPNVNTIIIDRADQFGLAQLYQLRGRVGRAANRAYAYLLHNRSYQMSETAQQRLKAIFEASSLGAGYRIAMKDLEIRGAGSILGVEQHGHIAAIGFDLYTRLLASEVERLKEEDSTGAAEGRVDGPVDLPPAHPSMSLPLDAFVPASFIEDDATRMAVYQRMAGLGTRAEVADMRAELADRFGKPPGVVENLLFVLEMRAGAEQAGIAAITTTETEIVIKLEPGATVDARSLTSRFGPLLKVGSATMRFDRRRLGGRWRENLLNLLHVMGGGVG